MTLDIDDEGSAEFPPRPPASDYDQEGGSTSARAALCEQTRVQVEEVLAMADSVAADVARCTSGVEVAARAPTGAEGRRQPPRRRTRAPPAPEVPHARRVERMRDLSAHGAAWQQGHTDRKSMVGDGWVAISNMVVDEQRREVISRSLARLLRRSGAAGSTWWPVADAAATVRATCVELIDVVSRTRGTALRYISWMAK